MQAAITPKEQWSPESWATCYTHHTDATNNGIPFFTCCLEEHIWYSASASISLTLPMPSYRQWWLRTWIGITRDNVASCCGFQYRFYWTHHKWLQWLPHRCSTIRSRGDVTFCISPAQNILACPWFIQEKMALKVSWSKGLFICVGKPSYLTHTKASLQTLILQNVKFA